MTESKDEREKMDVDTEERENETDNLEQALKFKGEGNKKFKSRKYREAVELYSKAIELCKRPEFYGNRAAAYMGMSRYNQALEDCLESVNINPKFVKSYVRGIKCYMALGNLSQGKNFGEKGLNNCNNDSSIVQVVNRIEIVEQKIERIYSKLNPIISKYQPPSLVLNKNNNNNNNNNNNDNDIKEKDDDLKDENDKEKNENGLLLENEKKDMKIVLNMLNDLLQNDCMESKKIKSLKVVALLYSQNYTECLSYGTTVMRSDKNNLEFIRLRSLALFYNEQYDQAIKHCQQILRRDPDNKTIKLLYKHFKLTRRLKDEGNQALKTGKLDLAINKYTECLKIDKMNHSLNSLVFANRASVYLKKKEYEKAYDDLTHSITLNPTYAKAYFRRSTALIELERFNEAVQDAEKAAQMDPHKYRDHLRKAKSELKRSKRKNYYKILGIQKDANETQIKKAFRKQAMKWHPDKFSTKSDKEKKCAEEKFKDIGEAYEVLKDPKLKKQYDMGYDLEDIKKNKHNPFHGHGGMDVSDIINLLSGMNGGGMGGGFPFGGMGGGMPGGQTFTFRMG